MNSELQPLVEQAQQASAEAHLATVCLLIALAICALFSVLAFWKLWQIRRTLEVFKTQLMIHLTFAQARNEILSKPPGSENPPAEHQAPPAGEEGQHRATNSPPESGEGPDPEENLNRV